MLFILPWKTVVSVVAILFGCIFAALALFFSPATPTEYSRYGLMSISITAIVAPILGMLLIKTLWKFEWFNDWFFPKIDGAWEGTIRSNWPIQEKLAKAAKGDEAPFDILNPKQGTLPELLEVPVKVTIEQKWFYLSMTLVSDYQGTRSRTLFVRPQRANPSEGMPHRILYIYEATPDVPLPTDHASHNGAAIVNIIKSENELILEGAHWTNRAWSKGLNTAGRISLRRPL